MSIKLEVVEEQIGIAIYGECYWLSIEEVEELLTNLRKARSHLASKARIREAKAKGEEFERKRLAEAQNSHQ